MRLLRHLFWSAGWIIGCIHTGDCPWRHWLQVSLRSRIVSRARVAVCSIDLTWMHIFRPLCNCYTCAVYHAMTCFERNKACCWWITQQNDYDTGSNIKLYSKSTWLCRLFIPIYVFTLSVTICSRDIVGSYSFVYLLILVSTDTDILCMMSHSIKMPLWILIIHRP